MKSRREGCGRDARAQRGRFLRGEGPGLLVMDEFQMLGDPMRGVHYEPAVALAPKTTQLLFLSGSVANPHDVVAWLQRIGRHAVLIEHKTRPVPLEETDLENLPDSQFVQSRSPSSPRPVFDRTGGSFWPRMIGRAMRADLAPGWCSRRVAPLPNRSRKPSRRPCRCAIRRH